MALAEHDVATHALPPLLYELDERPPWPKASLAAMAHLLAIVASIATAPLLVARGLQLDALTTSYVISSALIVSGLATLLQILRVGPFGSGLLSIQGTSFSFIGALMIAGQLLDADGMSDSEIVGVLLGSAAVGALVTVVAGYFIENLARVITPNVTGIAIFLLGLTLVGAAWNNFGFALAAAEASNAQGWVWAQAVVVIVGILFFATRSNPWLRLASITIGLGIGVLFAIVTGQAMPLPDVPLGGVTFLRWLPFPLGFDAAIALVLLPIFFVTMTESLGDLTATSMLSRQPLAGTPYWRRVRGGVMADGLNSVLAALAGTFPNTTFSQNNGVIRLTGVASRMVGVMVALLLILLGALPGFVALFQAIPGGVLHSGTGLLFAMIALTGLRLLQLQPNQRRTMIMLVGCCTLAFALAFVPSLLADQGIVLPPYAALLLGFPVASGAFIAVIWEWLAP
ncbi:MAG: purine/pyrimidine permease [Pseudomonadaceae bacterium]|nr:purine/pyrimidine permease [Pseudomonadaceae bacterium]